MAHNKRDTNNLTKLGLISHLDIYRDQNEMFVMPGYVSDNGYDGSATGLKAYSPQVFGRIGGGVVDRIFVLTKKLDGTGSKIFTRLLSGSEWTVPVAPYTALATEGTADLIDYPFFWWNDTSDFNYPVKSGSNTTVAQHGVNAADYNATWQSWLTATQPTGRTYAVRAFNGVTYLVKNSVSGISSITSSAVAPNATTTNIIPKHIASGDYQVGIAGVLDNPRRSQFLLWDSASLLADQNVQVGKGECVVIGYPNNIWAGVSVSAASGLEQNGKSDLKIRVTNGESTDVLYETQTVSPINSVTDIFALNDTYNTSMLWYGRLEVASGEHQQGIWALGKHDVNGQMGLSLLLNTGELNLVRNATLFGNSFYFIHNNDGSVSRLDNFQSGTYDVPATIETLIYGADSPYQKELQGVSIVTENLPSGGSVVCSYRTDEDSAWVPMGTSDTVGKQRHSFTKANGTPIGKFQEIQFKFVITGKTSVKNIRVDIIETENLPY
jgi:hypothetical protein